MIFNDDFWDDVADVTGHYAAAFAYGDSLPAMRRDLIRIFNNASGKLPTFEDLSALAGTSRESKDLITRKAAWLSQQVFKQRAWGVNSRLVVRSDDGKEAISPVVQVLEATGLQSQPKYIDSVDPDLLATGDSSRFSIDSVLFEIGSDVVYLICATSFRKLSSISKKVRRADESPSLYASPDRVLINARFDSAALHRLRLGKAIVGAAYPRMRVVPICLVIDDAPGSWSFQAHDVTSLLSRTSLSASFSLDELDVLESTSRIRNRTNGVIPDFSSIDVPFGANYLEFLPVDRATRPLMTLEVMIDAQAAHSWELCRINATEIEEWVRAEFGIAYSYAKRRHDIEAALAMKQMIKRDRSELNKYYLLPQGIVKSMLVKQMYVSQIGEDVGPDAIRYIETQGQLIREYRSGIRSNGFES